MVCWDQSLSIKSERREPNLKSTSGKHDYQFGTFSETLSYELCEPLVPANVIQTAVMPPITVDFSVKNLQYIFTMCH